MGCAVCKKIQQRCRHRVYHGLLGAKRGLRNVSQRGSFLQIGTLLRRQDHSRSPCPASRRLGWYRGWHGMRSEEENPHPTAMGCKSVWPHGEPCRASLHPCHPLPPPDLEGPPPSWFAWGARSQSHAELLRRVPGGFLPLQHQLCKGHWI